jgi:hypothetical protein
MHRSFRPAARLGCIVVFAWAAACGPHDGSVEEATGGVPGQLEVWIVDHEDGSSEMRYALRVDPDRALELEVSEEPPGLASGDRVVVFGTRLGDRMVVDDIHLEETDDDGVGSREEALTGNGVRTRSRAAALLVHWDQPDGMTPQNLRNQLFSASGSTAQWHRENSFGQVEIDGDAFGWFRIAPPSGCDYRTIAARAQAAARNAGVNVDAYDHLLYYFPRTGVCGWGGLASVGRPFRPARDSWYNGRAGCVVLAHELLHNYGARHSRSYSCSGGRAMAGPASCSFHEYGDRFDVMGGGCFHTNSYQKSSQGWFGGCNVVTVHGDGTFDVEPTQTPSNGIQSLRIPVRGDLCPSEMSGCFYTVEYRQPQGRIEGANGGNTHVYRGVLVHVVPPADFSGSTRPTHPYLLDMHPATRTFEDAPLLPGEVFQDPAGVRVQVLSVDSRAARVRVELPGGGAGGAVCIDGSHAPGSGQSRDTTPPVIAPLSPEDGATEVAHGQVTIAARLTDDVEVARGELLWSHGEHSWAVECDTAEGAFRCSRSGDTYTWTVAVGREGVRTWRVRGTDTSGNTATSASRRVDVIAETPDDGAPRVDLLFPINNALLSEHITMHFLALAESPEGIDGAELHWWDDGTTRIFDCETPEKSVSCTRSGGAFTWALDVEGAATRFWRVRVTDAAGQQTTSPWRRLQVR